MSPRPDVSAERKPQILQAALRVFARKGFHASHMDEIAAEAGLSVGILYWYYKGKEELTLALLDLFFTSDVQAVQQLLDAPGTCRARVWDYFAANLHEERRMLSLTLELRSQAARNPRLQIRLQAYYGQYHAFLVAMFQQGMARGELRPIDPQAAAVAVLALYDGLLQNLPQMLASPADPETLDGLIQQAFNLLSHGAPEGAGLLAGAAHIAGVHRTGTGDESVLCPEGLSGQWPPGLHRDCHV
jgi:TetR/AcrR family fatty acid metabolism transcriptional regulator